MVMGSIPWVSVPTTLRTDSVDSETRTFSKLWRSLAFCVTRRGAHHTSGRASRPASINMAANYGTSSFGQEQKNRITLKGSTAIVTEFFGACYCFAVCGCVAEQRFAIFLTGVRVPILQQAMQ